MKGKLIIFSAPSGSGKTTIVKKLLAQINNLEFSISATTRSPRGEEKHGNEYYFLSVEAFEKHIAKEEFIEHEEVYKGAYYGTLKSEIERIWAKGHHVIFDIDVIGGLNIEKLYGERALSIFVQPPSIEELKRRLEGRQTETADKIKQRLDKAETEIAYKKDFNYVLVNDDLETAVTEAHNLVLDFLKK